jgi:hypothetical protein
LSSLVILQLCGASVTATPVEPTSYWLTLWPGWPQCQEVEDSEDLLDSVIADPASNRLAALEERLRSLGPTSTESEIAVLALDYGQALTDFYDAFTSSRLADSSVMASWSELRETLISTASNHQQRDVLSRAAVLATAHATGEASSQAKNSYGTIE